jgi:hypothetical protein
VATDRNVTGRSSSVEASNNHNNHNNNMEVGLGNDRSIVVISLLVLDGIQEGIIGKQLQDSSDATVEDAVNGVVYRKMIS